MPCLNWRKLLPARKAWRILTNKLQRKLQKIHRSKYITKKTIRRSRHQVYPRNPILFPSNKLPSRFKRKRPKTKIGYLRHVLFQSKSSAVYIDQLFIEPVSVLKEPLQLPTTAESQRELHLSLKNKENKVADCQLATLGGARSRNEEITRTDENMLAAADELWESLALASPQMYGINERAEEFIAKFRAGMRSQELSSAKHS